MVDLTFVNNIDTIFKALFGVIIVLLLIYIITIIDIIRDRNWLWFVLIFIIPPPLNFLIYWLFGNKPS